METTSSITRYNSNVGITLNNSYLSGIKYYITPSEELNIPVYYEYNSFQLINDGTIKCDGIINIIS